MLPDAEVLKVVVDILSKLEIGQFKVKVNHRKFLDAIVEMSGCEKRKFKTICASIDKLDKEPWEKVRDELIVSKGLTPEQTEKLAYFVEFKGDCWQLLNDLKTKEVFKDHASGQETIKEMELLFTYLDAMGVIDNILFDFSLARGLDYYTGLIYEAVLMEEGKVGSIAGGGRYDGLVGMFSGTNIPAIGVSIGIERVFALLEEKSKNDPSIRQNQTQVLVAQAGKNLTMERYKVLNDLWNAGINAETVYKDNPNSKKQLDFAFEFGIPVVIWIGQDEVDNGVVKVKLLNSQEQVEVKRDETFGDKMKEIVQANPVLL
jgi:histidyl-tRNA synthetase